METLSFYRGETVKFSEGPIQVDGVTQDISSDSLRFVLKSKKSNPDTAIVINQPTGVAADVVTNGASGIGDFTLTNEDTDIAEGDYQGEIIWEPDGGGEYVVRQLPTTCLERVEDVP